MSLRFGLGFDSHPRDETRPLYLGGLRFEGEPGLAGHSDADVVCHAIADGLLGAAGLDDVGSHFPEDDPDIEGISGTDLLTRTVEIAAQGGVRPVSCDVTVICERPRIGDQRVQMREAVAAALGIDPAQVSIKGTRPEGMGLTGDGAACLALVVGESVSA